MGCLALVLAMACLGFVSASGTLAHISQHGGYELQDVMLGRSERKDYKGSEWLFFALNPRIDNFVSGSMLAHAGVWEGGLNSLFETLATEAKFEPKDMKLRNKGSTPRIVLDVGANVGAFSLSVASLGYHLYSFEMQERIFTLLELSRRVNGYYRMRLFHTALWNTTGHEVKFTPAVGNFGGTSVMVATGEVTMMTRRLDEFVPSNADVFFMKVDVENAEEYVLSGFSDAMKSGRVKHMVMETRGNQANLVGWFYDIGFVCGLYDRNFWTREAAVQRVSAVTGDAYLDIYCKFSNAPARRLTSTYLQLPSLPPRAGVYTPGHGWR